MPSVPPEGRDQDPTSFADILQELIWLEPRATAAVLIDAEGETVDYASSLPSYFTRVAAANLRVVLDDITGGWDKRGLGGLSHIMVRARRRTFFVRPLPDGYALVLVLRARVFAVSSRAVEVAVCRLAKEAGWPGPAEESLAWHAAEVETRRTHRFRPLQIKAGEEWEDIEVLGSVVGLAGEKGYRCRLQGGAEITLVRESTGAWFADQPARGLSGRAGAESAPPPPRSSSRAPDGLSPPRASGVPALSSGHASDALSPAPEVDSVSNPSGRARPHVGTSEESGDMWVKEAKRAR